MLTGKVAIITGASSGIGAAAAKLFADAGASIVANARGGRALDDIVAQINASGGKAVGVVGDVCEEATHQSLVTAAEDHFGRLDIGFNNAGSINPAKNLAEISLDEWSSAIGTNLTAAFLGARAQIPSMLRNGGGALVFTGSFVGNSVGIPGMTPSGAAKAGLMGLVRGITAEYATSGVRANALLAGGTQTPMAGDEAQRKWAAGLHAMKRLAEPEEIAQGALYLASNMASFVTGTALWVDGGNSAIKC